MFKYYRDVMFKVNDGSANKLTTYCCIYGRYARTVCRAYLEYSFRSILLFLNCTNRSVAFECFVAFLGGRTTCRILTLH